MIDDTNDDIIEGMYDVMGAGMSGSMCYGMGDGKNNGMMVV